jgi:hypothetical protein
MKNRFIKSNVDGSPMSSDEEYDHIYPKEKKHPAASLIK